MANSVFANGREIACKAAAGKTICAFPDVCFTPPENPATPPGVPIPYPNTGMASDTTDGSKKVKISDKEVGLKNKSCFKKSMGDEAGAAAKKGVITSKNTGKVFFNAWSMNVKIEGQNAVRHLDLTTNNHASMPGDTPPWPYLDEMSAAEKEEACGDEMEAVKNACPNSDKKGETQKDCPAFYKSSTKNSGYRNQKCVKAKRCMLAPYGRGPTTGGCCPGQTPHHLVPKHHFKKVSGYNERKAPCVCVEGHSWHRNDKSYFPKDKKTHADMHDRQDAYERAAIDWVNDCIEDGDDTMGHTPDTAMTYEEARSSGVAAHKETFNDCDPECSEKCLQAQIDAYHKHEDVGVNDDDKMETTKYGSKGESESAVDEFWNQVADMCAE